MAEATKQAPEQRAALTGRARTLAAQLVKGPRGRPMAVLGLWSGGPKPTPAWPACGCAAGALKTSTSH